MGSPVSLVDTKGVYVNNSKGTTVEPSIDRIQGSPSIATNQVTVNATATPIATARSNRNTITIVNSGTVDVFIGITGVTVANGVLLPGTKGASLTLQTTAAIFGIAATGTQPVSFVETY